MNDGRGIFLVQAWIGLWEQSWEVVLVLAQSGFTISSSRGPMKVLHCVSFRQKVKKMVLNYCISKLLTQTSLHEAPLNILLENWYWFALVCRECSPGLLVVASSMYSSLCECRSWLEDCKAWHNSKVEARNPQGISGDLAIACKAPFVLLSCLL